LNLRINYTIGVAQLDFLLEDNLALACLRRSEESEDEDMFELTSDEEEEELECICSV